MAFWIDVRIDGASALFIGVLVVVASLAAGIAPALQASGTDANEILKDESRGASSFRLGRFSKMLVVGEVALSCALLVASGLMIKGVLKLRNMDYGFEAEQLFVAEVEVLPIDYPDEASRVQFFERVEELVGAIPGVLDATMTSTLPARGNWNANVGFEGMTSDRLDDYPMTNYAQVTPSFFRVFQASLLDGRGFTSDDRHGNQPVAIVNQRFAEMYYPGERAVGRRIRRGGPRSQQPWRTIVGVVSNAHITQIDREHLDPDGVYLPLAQGSRHFTNIVLRTQGDPLKLTASVRAAVASVDPNVPLSDINTLAGDILLENKVFEVFGRLFLLFGGAALFLATVGLYGVMSFAVSRRTKEMGLRMALGAHRTDVLGIVVKQGMWQLAAGLALGLLLAGIMSRAMAMAFYLVDPWDKGIFGVIGGVLLLTGLLATLIPARRATRVDPMVALRYE
jgi:predicted permease